MSQLLVAGSHASRLSSRQVQKDRREFQGVASSDYRRGQRSHTIATHGLTVITINNSSESQPLVDGGFLIGTSVIIAGRLSH